MNLLRKNIRIWLFGTLAIMVSFPNYAGVFNTYTQDSRTFRVALNNPTDHSVVTDKQKKSKDAVLYLLEQARIEQVNQNYQESLDTYNKVFDLLNKQNNRAAISISRLGFKTLAALSNDSIVPYQVPPYEQVLAHIAQAKNYIFLHDLQGAAVEMRIAQSLQREIELKHEKELDKKSTKEIQANTHASVEDSFANLGPIASKLKNSYQNSYAFYMAANLWEVLGEYNDALVDYKKAYELQPDSQIAQDIERVNQTVLHKNVQTTPVIIFIEQGIIPEKIENKLAIPVPNGVLNFAFATYAPQTYSRPIATQIIVDHSTEQNSYVLNDIGALAVKQLKEQTTATISNQVVRATLKFAAQKQLGDQLGVLGQLAGNLLNISTERADLRAWSTLPSNTQVARLNLSPGTHSLQLRTRGTSSQPLTLEVGNNQTIFIYAYDINQKITLSSSTLTTP